MSLPGSVFDNSFLKKTESSQIKEEKRGTINQHDTMKPENITTTITTTTASTEEIENKRSTTHNTASTMTTSKIISESKIAYTNDELFDCYNTLRQWYMKYTSVICYPRSINVKLDEACNPLFSLCLCLASNIGNILTHEPYRGIENMLEKKIVMFLNHMAMRTLMCHGTCVDIKFNLHSFKDPALVFFKALFKNLPDFFNIPFSLKKTPIEYVSAEVLMECMLASPKKLITATPFLSEPIPKSGQPEMTKQHITQQPQPAIRIDPSQYDVKQPGKTPEIPIAEPEKKAKLEETPSKQKYSTKMLRGCNVHTRTSDIGVVLAELRVATMQQRKIKLFFDVEDTLLMETFMVEEMYAEPQFDKNTIPTFFPTPNDVKTGNNNNSLQPYEYTRSRINCRANLQTAMTLLKGKDIIFMFNTCNIGEYEKMLREILPLHENQECISPTTSIITCTETEKKNKISELMKTQDEEYEIWIVDDNETSIRSLVTQEPDRYVRAFEFSTFSKVNEIEYGVRIYHHSADY
jgi:hypothetical protein